jgi:hypothetical protein
MANGSEEGCFVEAGTLAYRIKAAPEWFRLFTPFSSLLGWFTVYSTIPLFFCLGDSLARRTDGLA